MRLGLFTDSHFSSAEVTCRNRYNSKSLNKIKKAFEYFKSKNCDLVICLGDLTDTEDDRRKEVNNLKAISGVINQSSLKTFVVMGNHDAFTFDVQEFYDILGNQYKPHNIFEDEKSLIFLDACYFKNGVHYKPGDTDWEDTYYPHTDELRAQLSAATGETYIFLHQNIDPDIHESHRLSNDADIRNILEKSGKVNTVFQGHYHPGYRSECGGIHYVTFPAMCENDNAWYVIEI